MLSLQRGVLVARTLVFLLAALLTASGTGRAQSPPRRIVVRLSGDLIAPTIERPFDDVLPVDEVILGVRAIGDAHVTGQPELVFTDDPDSAAFFVQLAGTIQSQTVGRKGPVEIHSRSQTRFTATKRVVYRPGRGFVGQPAQIAAQTSSQTERIEPDRGGILGRVIERRAWRRVGQSREAVNQIVQAKAEAKIRAAFDRLLECRLARVNRLADQRYAVAAALGGEGTPRYECCTRHGCLIIAASTGESSNIGEQADELIARGQQGPPMQVWVHESVVGNRTAVFLRQVNLIRRLFGAATLAEALPAAALPDNPAHPSYDFATFGDWIVVHSGGWSSAVADVPAEAERLAGAGPGR